MNTSPANSNVDQAQVKGRDTDVKLREFMLSTVQPCEVTLVSDASQQTQPSKTKAELLADGQCEV